MLVFTLATASTQEGGKDVMRQGIIKQCLLVTAYVIVAIGIVLGVVACGQDEGPFSPSGQDPGLNEATVTINGVKLLKAPGGLRLASSASAKMDQAGGTISIGDAWLTVPTGALSSGTTITMAHASDLWAYDFGPDGLQFNTSATLTVKITLTQLVEIGVDPYDLRIAYATNGFTNDWQILGGSYDPIAQEISLPVDHFSRYSLCIE